MVRAFRACGVVVAVALAAACTVKDTQPPALAGPSELGLSLSVQAVPDVVIQDGESRTQVVVTARDPMAQPVRNLALRVEIYYRNTLVDYGTLAPGRNIVTGSDGKAMVTYTPPRAPAQSSDTGDNIVTILVTPLGTDYATAVPRQVQIRLVPPGVIIAPTGALFTWSPTSPTVGKLVYFDGSLSTAPAGRSLKVYEWDFGDGDHKRIEGSAQTTHDFVTAGDFLVRLTVTDSAGSRATVARSLKVIE
jgi:hypothetical protein